MMPRDIYNLLGYVTGEDTITRKVQVIVNSRAMKGYIEPENTDKSL